MSERIALRDYQTEAVASVEDAFERGMQRPLVGLPTGCGKTIIFGELGRRRVENEWLARENEASLTTWPGGRVLIVAHRDELLTQAIDKLGMLNPVLRTRTGVVKADRDDVHAQIVVSSVQTLARARRLDRLAASGDFDLVVIDEAHHAVADSYMRVLRGLGCFDAGGPPAVGFTATPMRADGRKIGDAWEDVVYHRTILEMIAQGYLCNLRGISVKLREADFTKLKVTRGDFQDGEVAEMLHEANAPAHALAAWQEHAADRKTLIFAPTVALSQELAETFHRGGVAAEHVDGTTPELERRGIWARFKVGETQVVSNVGVATEGFDEPSVSCILMARPTRSNVLYAQVVGRGTRTYPGKEDCLVLDLVGATERLDLMTLPKLGGVTLEAFADAEGSLLDAHVAEEEKRRDGELVARNIDLFRRRHFHWIQIDPSRWIISASERLYAVKINQAGTWLAERYDGREGAPSVLGDGLDLGYAQGLVEDQIRAMPPTDKGSPLVITNPDARWRKAKPKDTQIATLRKFRVYEIPGTAGEASDEIAKQIARVRGVI